MACGALPIIFPNGALPEIADGVGKMVNRLDEAEQAIMQSFSLSPSERRQIAKYAEKFSLVRRAEKFEAVISELTAKDSKRCQTYRKA
jgi:K+/H+ antiporter YhaU regulatory subunit KhtT